MSYEEMEDNENRFVSLFADRYDLGCASIYVNKVMNDDPFFNRLTDIRCKDIDSMLNKAEDIFRIMNVKPFVYCFEDQEQLKDILLKHGYEFYDRLSTLMLEHAYRLKGVKNVTIINASIDEWLDVYCEAFDSINYRDELRARLSNSKGLMLYIAKMDDISNGCMALLASNTILGLYCLGVLKEYRKHGIAATLLRYAYDVAESKGLNLILQTMLKDNLLNYYLKRGFTQIYAKDIYTKSS